MKFLCLFLPKIKLNQKIYWMTIIMYTDGGARGNPGPAATGVALYLVSEPAQEIVSKITTFTLPAPIATLSTYLGETTNNVAEWQAVVEGLQWIKENHPSEDVVGVLDSELVQRQIIGRYKIKDPKMKSAFTQMQQLLSPPYMFVHVPRALNKVTDALVNQTLDQNN